MSFVVETLGYLGVSQPFNFLILLKISKIFRAGALSRI